MSALFGDLIGQSRAVDLLSAALAQERVAPAYLFAGPEGVGRQLAALRFLEGLLADGQPSARERRRQLTSHPFRASKEIGRGHTALGQGRRKQINGEGLADQSPKQSAQARCS